MPPCTWSAWQRLVVSGEGGDEEGHGCEAWHAFSHASTTAMSSSVKEEQLRPSEELKRKQALYEMLFAE